MAVLSKIRQRGALLILVIGFCLLAFIVQDLFQGGIFSDTRNVGSVNGEDITYEAFNKKVGAMSQNGQAGLNAVNNIWEQEVTISLVNAEFEKLGIRATDAAINKALEQSQIGQNPLFLNQAGKFTRAKFDEFYRSNKEQQAFLDTQLEQAALTAKYMQYAALIKGAMYTTSTEGKMKYEMETKKITFDYVGVPFSSIKDSDVKVSDDEIIAYMKKDEKRFKSDEVRELEYVLVSDKASPADEEAVKKELEASIGANDSVAGLANAKDIADFVTTHSELPYDSTFVAKQDLPAQFVEQLYNLPVGGVFGPYKDGEYYKASRMVAKDAGAKVRSSHILISYKGTPVAQNNPAITRTKEEAEAKAKEVFAAVTANPDSFMLQAMTNSDDTSKQQGGDIGFQQKGGPLTKKYADYIFNNPVGKIGLVETEFGYHIVKATEKQDGVRLATIAKKIEASKETSDKAYADAQKFEDAAKTKDFTATAKSFKLTVNPPVKVKPVDDNFGVVGSQRQIVKWAFDKATVVGDVKRFDIPNQGSVIAKLKKINPEGLMAVEDARPAIEPLLKNKKKAELIKAKMKGGSLDAIAKANNTTVQTATDVTIETTMLAGVGMEQKVGAVASVTKVGKMSAPIEGNSGVYVVVTKAVTEAPARKEYKEFAAKLNGMNASAPNRAIQSLRDNADIEDNRALFY
ncbi:MULTISPECIES: peptidylprolyl isomerase [unclassified Flavobacterium]|uniref:peptidylprolyl isomerase n=1 Tax=unclassified Flavobacterium TaxID=196869 RepID=UPI001F146D90|nr:MULTISPECIES: peptidylprolyl isomerase [unclassified Flavobacterium]UMY65943.1 SurA N-terminal domain-containing protein [Flavobacterium sp. HJ-32-4]